jgi:hypothetical protein
MAIHFQSPVQLILQITAEPASGDYCWWRTGDRRIMEKSLEKRCPVTGAKRHRLVRRALLT